MKTLLLLAASLAIAITAQAQTTTFTFGSNSGGGESQLALDDKASGSVTVNGLTFTAAANTGTFNSTSTAGFGINGSESGDSTTEFDLTDSMTFSFSQAVTLNTIDLNVFGTTDSGFLTYSGGTVNITSDPFSFTGISLAAGEVVTFGANAGSSFSLQSLTVTPNAAIPEPSVYMLLGVGLLFCGQRFARKRAVKV